MDIFNVGCENACGFVRAGLGYQCLEGSACGLYVHPDEPAYKVIHAYYTQLEPRQAVSGTGNWYRTWVHIYDGAENTLVAVPGDYVHIADGVCFKFKSDTAHRFRGDPADMPLLHPASDLELVYLARKELTYRTPDEQMEYLGLSRERYRAAHFTLTAQTLCS